MFEKTVREVALEARVAELQRENDLLKRVATREQLDMVGASMGRPIAEGMVLPYPAPPTIQLHRQAVWSVEPEERGILRVIGEARCADRDAFHIAHYVDELRMVKAQDALVVLGDMHRTVIKRLAQEYARVAA